MHFDDSVAKPHTNSENLPWWKGLTSYQWFVFAVASLGWLFDTMDQQLFNLARISAVRSLLGATPGDEAMARQVNEYGGYATTIFMIGWALGGIAFGILGDKLGRAKTMLLTVLCYSAFTGLSALFGCAVELLPSLPIPASCSAFFSPLSALMNGWASRTSTTTRTSSS